MKYRLLQVLMCGALATARAEAPPADATANVTALIQLLGDGIAQVSLAAPPVIKYGRLFGGPLPDAVTFFTLEGFGGSNHHVEYVAFFASVRDAEIAGNHSRPYRLVAMAQIGARGWRSFDWKSVVLKRSAVTVSGEKMGPGDALCCPSVPITATFQVDAFTGRIVER